MASIKGISLKNIKTFRGMEYPVNYQGSVYFNGKKLGFWSQDGNGGPDHYDFNTTELDKIAEAYYGEDRFYNLECLLGEVLTLQEYEKLYKKAVKDGYASVVIITDGYREAYIRIPKDIDKDIILKKCEQYVEDFTRKSNQKDKIETLVFTDITDFIK